MSALGTRRGDPDREGTRDHPARGPRAQERIYDLSIISKIPVTFARVMFAPEILASLQKIADEFGQEIAQLRIIARDAAVTAELWIRSKHGTWRFFVVTATSLVEIDREGKPVVVGLTIG